MDCAWIVALDRPVDGKKPVKRVARYGGRAMRVLRDRNYQSRGRKERVVIV
jgi:hypothetical protein